MQKPRQYERFFLIADVAVQPNNRRPPRHPARMFNVSKAGAAVFTTQHFAKGDIVGLEMNLPATGRRTRRFMLHGIVRHVDVQAEGNVLGIEFVVSDSAGDYEALTLTENPAGSGFFEGSINTVVGSPTNSSGVLEVADGDTILATYNDADDGTGTPATVTDTAASAGRPVSGSITCP